jgi:hypothetical protein
MTEAEKTKIREAIKNDVKLSESYKNLLDAKKQGRLRKDINPDEVMVTLVAKYGTNAAGLVDAALSRPADVMKSCNQKFQRSSGTLKYLTTGKATDKQIAAILGKTEAQVKKDKALKGTRLPATRETVKTAQKESKVTRRIDARQVDGITGAAVKAHQPQNKTNTKTAKKTITTRTTNNTTKQTTSASKSPSKAVSGKTNVKPKTNGKSAFSLAAPVYESNFDKKLKAEAAAKKKEQDLQNLYSACNPSIVGGPVELKTLMEKGLVSQKDIQAYYNKHSKDFTSGISAGAKGKNLAKTAYNHAAGHRCVGGCLSGVQEVNSDVPWGNDPAWDKYQRPGQDGDNWGCDTYKVLEDKGYITVAIENHSTGRESPGAVRVRRTVAGFPEGTTVSFDNQIDAEVTKPEQYYGVIQNQTHPSKRCGHVAVITKDGLCSDGFQSHNNGYDPTNYGRKIHFSLPSDTQVSEDLAKQLIAEAYARREREAVAKAKQNATRGASR